MPLIRDICDFLEQFAPTRLAEDWDNVGLLVGDPEAAAERVMTCLTVTPSSADEAIERNCQLIVTHHPLPFRPLKRLTTDQTASRLLWNLIRNGISIYSPHTGFDSAKDGINQAMGQTIGLSDLQPIIPWPDDPDQLGSGRVGRMNKPVPLSVFLQNVKSQFQLSNLQFVGSPDATVSRIGMACGSGASFLADAIRAGCDTLMTGEASFHHCLEAEANQVNLVLMGHYASERFAVEILSDRMQGQFPGSTIWCSERESDPIKVF